MVEGVALAVLAYLSPALLGFALYLTLFREPRPVEGIAFGFGVGAILVNILLMIANQLFFLPFAREWILPTAVVFTGSALFLLAWRRERLLAWASRSHAAAIALVRRPVTLVLLVGPALLLLFLLAKAVTYPETGPDSIFYHLYLARAAFENGDLPRTAGLGWLEMPNAFPNLVVTQQIWIYYVAGSAAQVLSRPLVPLYTILLSALLVETGNRLRSGSGPLALLLLTSWAVSASVLPEFLTPTLVPFGRLSVEIWTDLPVTFYALLSLHFVLKGFRRPEARLWGAAGLFAGGAVLTKYNGLAFAAILASLVLVYALLARRAAARVGEDRFSLSPLLAFLLPLALLTGLFFLRNVWLFENPVYPFYTQLLGGVNPRSAQILTDFVPEGIGAVKLEQAYVLFSSLLYLLFLPSLTLRGPAFRLLQATAAVYLVYIFLPWGFLTAFYRMILPAFPPMALCAGAWLQGALFGAERVRYALLAATLALLAFVLQPQVHLAIAAAAVAGFALLQVPGISRGRRLGRGRPVAVASLLLVFSISLSAPSLGAVAGAKYPTPTLGPFPVGLPLVADEEVLHQAYGADWELWQWMNENLPSGSQVMTLHPSRYYVNARLVCPASETLVGHYDSSLEEAIVVLQAAGVTYVLDSAATRTYVLTQPFWAQSSIFQGLNSATHFELAYQSPFHLLYRIRG